MVDKKTKTKTAMMQELESIKGLLLEEDEIPILQEVIDSESNAKSTHSPLSQHDLAELHDQFKALSQSIEGKAGETSHHRSQAQDPTPPAHAANNLLDAFTRVPQPNTAKSNQPAPTPLAPKLKQPSLFQEIDEPDNSAHKSEKPVPSQPTNHAIDHHPLNETSATPNHYRDAPPSRPLAKASGENPFLPQHIRARLHGNNPPPMFDYAAGAKLTQDNFTSQPHFNSQTDRLSDNKKSSPYDKLAGGTQREQLIKEVIDALMPQLEKQLFERLEELSQQELELLRHPDA